MAELPEEPADEVAGELSFAATTNLADSLALEGLSINMPGRKRRARRVTGSGAGQDAGAAIEHGIEMGEAQQFLAKQSRMLDIQMEHLHEQRGMQLSHLRLRRMNELLKLGLQGLTIVVGLMVVAGVILMAWQAKREDSLVIEPMRSTPELTQRGLDGVTLATQLLDRLRELQNSTDSARAATAYKTDWGGEIKVEIPETGVSIGELQRTLRQVLGHETHISGEVYRGWPPSTADALKAAPAQDQLVLTVRAGSDPGDAVRGSASDLDAMMQAAAEKLFARTQPYRYAVFLSRHDRVDEAIAAIRKVALTGPDHDRAWAYANWGSLLNRKGDVEGGLQKGRQALALDPDLALAHDNMGGVELALGRAGSAVDHLEKEADILKSRRAKQLAPRVRPILQAWALARVSEAHGDFAAARRHTQEVYDQPDYQGSADSAMINEAAVLAMQHEVSASRRLMVSARIASPTFRENVELGGAILPEVAQDLALEDWPALLRDIAAAEAVAPSFLLGGYAQRTYLWPWRAYALARTGDLVGATALIDRTPTDCYLCLRMRGRIAALQGRRNDMETWFSRARRLAPDLPWADLDFGDARLEQKDASGAITAYRRAHDLSPGFADPLEHWGEALLAQGDAKGSLAKFAAAAVLAPRWGRLHLMWGVALARTGHSASAIGQQHEAEALDLAAPDRQAVEARLKWVASVATPAAKH